MRRGIPSSLVELCQLPEITKGRAAYLHSIGIMNAEDIKENIDNIRDEIDEEFSQALRRIADGVR